jgi:hypothetical protein
VITSADNPDYRDQSGIDAWGFCLRLFRHHLAHPALGTQADFQAASTSTYSPAVTSARAKAANRGRLCAFEGRAQNRPKCACGACHDGAGPEPRLG